MTKEIEKLADELKKHYTRGDPPQIRSFDFVAQALAEAQPGSPLMTALEGVNLYRLSEQDRETIRDGLSIAAIGRFNTRNGTKRWEEETKQYAEIRDRFTRKPKQPCPDCGGIGKRINGDGDPFGNGGSYEERCETCLGKGMI